MAIGAGSIDPAVLTLPDSRTLPGNSEGLLVRCIAIANQKGGSCKTTTTVCLAAALSEKGKRVLVIDLDPQASATSWYGLKDGGRGLLDVLTNSNDETLVDLVCETNIEGVDIVPSSSWLGNAERALAGEVVAEVVLKKSIQGLPRGRWDYLLLDCPPTLGLLTICALAAAQEVLVPVECHVMALQGLAQLSRIVEVVKERLNRKLAVSAILLCRVDRRTRHSPEIADSLRTRFGKRVLSAIVRENVKLAEAPSFAQPITRYAPSSRGAEDYRSVAVELLKKWRS